MKYAEIIGLNEYFQPVYDLKNERGYYWKQFIPCGKFYRVLSEVINSLESSDPQSRKSIWLQGSYGTGKSHATAVVKHLLCDDLADIQDFLSNLDNQFRYRLENFRKHKRVFPVVIKGTAGVTDNRTFALVVERAVKESVFHILPQMDLTTDTDFEKMINKLEGNEINWEVLLQGSELEMYGDRKTILSKLREGNVSILRKLEDLLSQHELHISPVNLTEWLLEVHQKLVSKGIADYLMIFWDEFTGILELPKSGLLVNELQNVAELSSASGVFLFVVVHRKPAQVDLPKEDVEKVKDRFKVLDYSMEPVTTYHVMSAAIKKKDQERYEELKEARIEPVKFVVREIAGKEGTQVMTALENLFPIHPYTAYLSTLIARNIGSTERSIFKFLYDEEAGFKAFLKKFPQGNAAFLTADRLWDFFLEDFQRIEVDKAIGVIEYYNLYEDILRQENHHYLAVLKGILLLNLLHRLVEVGEESLVAPSERNILMMFAGAIEDEILLEALSFIDKRIISKTPTGLYLLTGPIVDSTEIAKERQQLLRAIDTAEKVLDRDHKEMLRNVVQREVHRPLELIVLGADMREHILRRKLEKAFKKKYTIHVSILIAQNEQDRQEIITRLPRISAEEEFTDVIFIVPDLVLDEHTLSKYVDYRARAAVLDKHNRPEEKAMNEEWARKTIDSWLKQLTSGYGQWFLQGKKGKELLAQMGRKISKEFVQSIFPSGLDRLGELLENRNIWQVSRSKKSAEIFLFAKNREELESRTSKGRERYLREILKDRNGEYVVDMNLKPKPEVSAEHPLKRMANEIDKALGTQQGVFNLAESLQFLTEPPYGLYPSMVCMACLGFLMRNYVGKLYEARTGIPLEREVMRDRVVDIFDYWEEKRDNSLGLDVRFGTEEEEQLISCLSEIFQLDKQARSLNEIRWEIRKWLKEVGTPIWLYKYVENANPTTREALEAIERLVHAVDSELDEKKIKTAFRAVDEAKYDLAFRIKNSKPHDLFTRFLQSIEGADISPNDVSDVLRYIRHTLPEEVSSWTEDQVREKVKDWKIEQLKRRTSDHIDYVSPPHPEPAIRDSWISGNNLDEVRMIEQIKRLPLHKLQQLIFRVIGKHPEVALTIREMLSQEKL